MTGRACVCVGCRLSVRRWVVHVGADENVLECRNKLASSRLLTCIQYGHVARAGDVRSQPGGRVRGGLRHETRDKCDLGIEAVKYDSCMTFPDASNSYNSLQDD